MFKYLSFNFSQTGAHFSSIKALLSQLHRIEKALLKPAQKLMLVKYYLLPRYIYSLQNLEIKLKTLNAVDHLVRYQEDSLPVKTGS